MLEGVQIDIAAVQRFIGKVVGVEFHDLDINAGVLLIQQALDKLPGIVFGAAYADPDDLLAFPGRLIGDDRRKIRLRQGDVFRIVGEGGEGGVFAVFAFSGS